MLEPYLSASIPKGADSTAPSPSSSQKAHANPFALDSRLD